MWVQHSYERESEANCPGDYENKRLFTINFRPKGDVRNVSMDGSENVAKTERRMKLAGITACVSATVFAIPHFWYYLGVSIAYPGDFPSTMPHSEALLIVGGFALLAAVYAIAFTHLSFVRRLPELIVTLPAWFGAIGFTAWGLAYYGLQILLAFDWVPSTSEFAARNADPNAIWGYFWYSLFILWGLSLGITAFFYHRLKKSQESRTDGNSRP